jgi:hypothetical protein
MNITASTTEPSRTEKAPTSLTTKAVVCREPGKPWEVTELELDPPKANEVRIKFYAAGL